MRPTSVALEIEGDQGRHVVALAESGLACDGDDHRYERVRPHVLAAERVFARYPAGEALLMLGLAARS